MSSTEGGDEKLHSADDDYGKFFKSVLNRNTNRGWHYNNSNASLRKDNAPPTNSHSWTVTSRVEGVTEAFGISETDTSDVIPDWSMALVKVRFFVVKDGEIDSENQIGPPIRVTGRDAMNIYMKQVSKLRLSRVHHFATLGEYMHNLNKQQKLADVIVRVNDQIFTANRHVLSCHSNFFAKLFINSSVPAYAVTDVTLTDVTTEDFAHFIHFVHIGDIHLSPENVSSLLNLSVTLQSETLRAQILVFLSKETQLSLGKAVSALKDPKKDQHRPEAIATIIYRFQELLEHPLYLREIDLEAFMEIISSEYTNINSELDVFWVVLYWTACGHEDSIQHLHELMPSIRFGTMSTMELMDCARASEAIGVSHACRNLLVQANWISYIREKGIKDPLKVPTQYPRLILQDAPSHETTVHEFDMRYLLYKKLASHFDSSGPGDMSIEEELFDTRKPRVRFAEEVEVAEIKPWGEDEGDDLEGVRYEGLDPEKSSDSAIISDSGHDVATGIVRSDESKSIGRAPSEERLDYESLSLGNLTKSLMNSASGSPLGYKGSDAETIETDQPRSTEADVDESQMPTKKDKMGKSKSIHKDQRGEDTENQHEQDKQSAKESVGESSHENNASNRTEHETTKEEMADNVLKSSEVLTTKNESSNKKQSSTSDFNLSNFIREDDSFEKSFHDMSQKDKDAEVLHNDLKRVYRDVMKTKYFDASIKPMPTGRVEACEAATFTGLFSEAKTKTGAHSVPIINDDLDGHNLCQYSLEDSVLTEAIVESPFNDGTSLTETIVESPFDDETSRSQEIIDFRNLLDRRDVEMSLIPGPLLPPEATPSWRYALANKKKRTFMS